MAVLVRCLMAAVLASLTAASKPLFCSEFETITYNCSPHKCDCHRCPDGSCHVVFRGCHGSQVSCSCLSPFWCCQDTKECCDECWSTCEDTLCTESHDFEITDIGPTLGTVGRRGIRPVVTVTGSGFVNSGDARCWFIQLSQPSQMAACTGEQSKVASCLAESAKWVQATVVDNTTITCQTQDLSLPQFPSGTYKSIARLEVSLAPAGLTDINHTNFEGLTDNGLEFTWFKCPLDCSNHGDCIAPSVDGSSGVCHCDHGYFGEGCAGVCPGLQEDGSVCSGRGECSGTGVCTCEDGWYGTECQMECPGGAASPCNGHGSCNDHGHCVCDHEWRGQLCDKHCPTAGTPPMVCDNHGECNSAGSCACELGYHGPACESECPGGADNPCTHHGTCMSNGECLCGPSFVGMACDHKGSCRDLPTGERQCTCEEDRVSYGDNCTEACDCAEHGACSYSGACNCDQGFWGSRNETHPECANQCPGVISRYNHFPNVTIPCNGHGNCSQVDGSCACERGYGGAACEISCPADAAPAPDTSWEGQNVVCAAVIGKYPGYYGRRRAASGVVNVSRVNISNNTGLKLSYHLEGLPAGTSGGLHIHAGTTCSDPRMVGAHFYTPHGVGDPDPWQAITYAKTSASGTSSGEIEISPGFGLEPAGSATVRGHSVVVHLSGSSAREPTNRFGCGIIRCSLVDVPLLCSGNGQCNEEGRCDCGLGFWKQDCSGVCPQGVDKSVCSGHGSCSLSDGLCSCSPGWAGMECQLECPGNVGNPVTLPCSGHGHCLLQDASCTCINGYFGESCNSTCPGFDEHLGACSGHGSCSRTDGTCSCQAGYFGADCQGECPRTDGLPCAGHGLCRQSIGTCACDYGYVADKLGACTTECKGGAMDPCAGHGRCDEAGECACIPGYAGDSCNATCPGYPTTPCNFPHGQCQADGTCRCNPEFRGPNCTESMCENNCNNRGVCHGLEGCRCELGYWGKACENKCPGESGNPCGGLFQGFCTAKGTCTCHTGFFGYTCMDQCPHTEQGGLCNGQGSCGAEGECECNIGWYDENCTSKMSTPGPDGEVELVMMHCDSNNGSWMFGIMDAIHIKFALTPQRLDLKTCTKQPGGTQILPISILGIPGRASSSVVAASITQKLTATPSYLGSDYQVISARMQEHSSGDSGLDAGAVVGIVFAFGVCVAITVVLFFKWDDVEAAGRKARRWVLTRVYGDQLDVDEDGTSYGDGHAGSMHKANTETTYELEGAAAVGMEDSGPMSIPRAAEVHGVEGDDLEHAAM